MGTRANCLALRQLGLGLSAIFASILLSACDLTALNKSSTTQSTGTATTTTTPASPASPASPATPTAAAPLAPPSTVIGSASVSWQPPQQNADGSALTDMAGYRIYFGNSASSLTQVVNIASVGVTRYVIDNLAAGTWYFAVRAFNSAGIESELSNIASKTIG